MNEFIFWNPSAPALRCRSHLLNCFYQSVFTKVFTKVYKRLHTWASLRHANPKKSVLILWNIPIKHDPLIMNITFFGLGGPGRHRRHLPIVKLYSYSLQTSPLAGMCHRPLPSMTSFLCRFRTILLLPRLGRNCRNRVGRREGEPGGLLPNHPPDFNLLYGASAQPGKQQIRPKSTHFYASGHYSTCMQF